MTDLVVVPQAAHWQRLKRLVLDSVSSPIAVTSCATGAGGGVAWQDRRNRRFLARARPPRRPTERQRWVVMLK